jgi:hypothetical protein
LLALLSAPVKGDASLILAHQLIPAKLNIFEGGTPNPIASALDDADVRLSAFGGKLPYNVSPASPAGSAMVSDASILGTYNAGLIATACR